nr:MAG TPA: protein of unknown function (DUF4160) [Caudoviricetes sp.]
MAFNPYTHHRGVIPYFLSVQSSCPCTPPHIHVHKGLGRASRTHVNPNQLIIMIIKYYLFTSSFRYYYVIPHSLLNK